MKTSQMVMNGLLALVLVSRTVSEYKVACYYTASSQNRAGVSQYSTNNVEFSLCTHILYAAAGIRASQIVFSLSPTDEGRVVNTLVNLKRQYEKQNLATRKISVLVQSDINTFSALARTNASRQAFVNSTIQFLRRYGFDGVELDWSYPSTDDRHSYTLLCQDLLMGFIADGMLQRKERLLISAAVSALQSQIDQSYEIQELASIVDWINVKAYNLFPNQDNPTRTHLHSALYGSNESDIYSADYAVRWWTGHGMIANKILLGMPTYGRTFILRQLSDHGILSASNGKGRPDSYTNDQGSKAFYAICEDQLFQQNKIRDAKQRQVYSWNSDTWVSFDDEQLATEKCSYVKSKSLGGVAIWSLDLDDFTGTFCSRGTYPLIRNVSSCLMAGQLLVNQTTIKATTDKVQTFPQFVQARLLAGGFSCEKPMAKAAALSSGARLLSVQWASISYGLSFTAAWLARSTAAAIHA